jgi:hypothetical protein
MKVRSSRRYRSTAKVGPVPKTDVSKVVMAARVGVEGSAECAYSYSISFDPA